jgi:DNA-binding NtrC family response regulator
MSARAKTILVVEDEAPIRIVVAEALIDAGFAIKEAAHADEALAVLDASADEIDLLFTDVSMPGSMNGFELAHHVHEAWPQMAMLIASGKPLPGHANCPPGSRFIPKPYAVDEVVDQIQTLVASD